MKQYLTVTATFEDSSVAEISGYTLSGTLAEGTSIITVTYQEKTTTFTATVSANAWKYTPDMGLLSAQDFVTSFDKANLSVLNETVTGNELKLAYTGSSSIDGKNASYTFTPSSYTSFASLKIRFKIISIINLATSNTTGNGAIQLRISDGTSGSKICFARYGDASASPRIRYAVGSAFVWDANNISTGEWHELEVINENGKQSIMLDGESVVSDESLSTSYTTANKLFVFGYPTDLDIRISNIEYRWQ